MKILIAILVAALLVTGVVLFFPRDKFCSVPYARETFYTVEENGLSSADFIHKRLVKVKKCPEVTVSELPYISIPPEFTK